MIRGLQRPREALPEVVVLLGEAREGEKGTREATQNSHYWAIEAVPVPGCEWPA